MLTTLATRRSHQRHIVNQALDTNLSYLDISISICSSKYVTEVYDKRDAFNSNFEEDIPNIYPPELTLERTSESDTNLSYLDISISICSSEYRFPDIDAAAFINLEPR